MQIVIGKGPSGKPVSVSLDILLRSRLLIQANSGGGKSWLIRRLAEQISGKIPQYIIDPEGEFPSLRPTFPFVLVGEGGETTPDPRAAELLAHRLLELRLSAVFDLSELKPQVRQAWTKAYLEALIELPRRLRTHHIVYLDEAHMFAPEGGKAEAFGAVVDAAGRGRKRGTCLIAATQRLSKLTKDVTGELLNRLIGPTFEDLDLERAEQVLSIPRSDRLEFEKRMRVLAPGNFEAVGRAFGTERLTVHVGPVETTHPEVGKSRRLKAPPAAIPEKIKALLPKLADLPKEAEDKAKTVEGLRRELISVKAELAQAKRAKPAPAPPPAVPKSPSPPREVAVLKAGQLAQLEKTVKRLEAVSTTSKDLGASLVEFLRGFTKDLARAAESTKIHLLHKAPPALPFARMGTSMKMPPVLTPISVRVKHAGKLDERYLPAEPEDKGDGAIPAAASRILRTLLTFESFGLSPVSRAWVGGWLGISHTSGGFRNMLGLLRTAALLSYPQPDLLLLTEAGRKAAPAAEVAADLTEILRHYAGILTGQPGKIFSFMTSAYPEKRSRIEVAEALGVVHTSGGFRNSLGALRTAGLITYPESEQVRASDWIFLKTETGVAR